MSSGVYDVGRAQPVAYRAMPLDRLEQLAEQALGSPDADERLAATEELRVLSHFEQWDTLADGFLGTQNQYALFVLCKAATYIVKNEVGPDERERLKEFLLEWCAHAGEAGGYPVAVVRQVLVVAATASFLNFRTLVLTSIPTSTLGGDADEYERQRAEAGTTFVHNLRRHLNGDLRLMTLFATELVTRFVDEYGSGGLRTVHDLFVTEVMPHLFQIATQTMESARQDRNATVFAECAALAVACLETPPAEGARTLLSQATTDEVFYLTPFHAWVPLLQHAFDIAAGRIAEVIDAVVQEAQDAGGNDAIDAAEVLEQIHDGLRLVVAISQVSWSPESVSEGLSALAGFATKCLENFTDAEWFEPVAVAGATVLVNILERHPVEADIACAQHEHLVESLVMWCQGTSAQWDTFSDRVRIPVLTAVTLLLGQGAAGNGRGGGPMSNTVAMARFPAIMPAPHENITVTGPVTMPPAAVPLLTATTPPAVPESPYKGNTNGVSRGPPRSFDTLNTSAGAKGYDRLMLAARDYLEAVLAHCYLDEASEDVHNADALAVVNEHQLKPLARLLIQCSNDLGPVVFEEFQKAVLQHELINQMRHGATLSEENANIVLAALDANTAEVDVSSIALFASRVVLSRIGVLMSVIGLMVHNRGLFSAQFEQTLDDLRMLHVVVKFARGFTTDDLADLLMCMDLGGSRKTAAAGIGASDAGSSSTLHVGVLRSLLFFCGAVITSGFGEQQVFVEAAASAMLFILSRHSLDAPVLAADCGEVLSLLSSDDYSSHAFLKGEPFDAVVEGQVTGQILLTNSEQGLRAAGESAKVQHQRKHVLRALARCIDMRARLGHDTSRTWYRLLDSISLVPLNEAASRGISPSVAFSVFLGDVRGIVRAIDLQPLMRAVLQWILNQESAIAEYVRSDPRGVGALLKTMAKVSRQCTAVLSNDGVSPLQPRFCKFVLHTVQLAVELSTPVGAPALGATELKHIAALLESLLQGSWCNVAVMIYYGDDSVSQILLHALRRLIAVDPADVVSLRNRDAFYDSIVAAFRVRDATVALRESEDYVQLCIELGRFLARCLRIAASYSLIRAIGVLFSPGALATRDVVGVKTVLVELTVLLATSGAVAEWTGMICTIVATCYRAFPAEAEEELLRLLDQAAAYHRVRIRCLLTLLRKDPSDMPTAFQRTFTPVGGENPISAW